MLEERLDKLELRLTKVKRDLTQAHSSDFADQAQERENDEVLDQIGNETEVSIQQIKAALLRIENSVYGICEDCGNEITSNRLEVIPESILCVSCAGK